MNRQPRLRAAFAVLCFALLAVSGAGQETGKPDPERAKKIADIERQIQELQSQLKSLKDPPPPTAPDKKTDSALPARWSNLFQWRSIGPANMGGRITGLAVYEADPCCYYVATASGGLLKTTNNGSTFEHQFDKEATVSIGAVAVSQSDRNLVWVGTGEANPRNSVSWGDGVYKSIDGGKTWKNVGLKQSFQIGKIIIHPKDNNIVYVGALGRLYGPSAERGLYKTSDGGKSWQRVLQVDNVTGVLELAMHPTDPEVLIAATWERQRDEFDSFRGDAKIPPAADVYCPVKIHGPGAGMYKSIDGGKTWKNLTEGLPKANMGRIGLDWHRKNPNLVFATIDTEKAGAGIPPAQAFLGVTTEGTPKGLRVSNVVADAPAQKAGLAVGETILQVDAKTLKTPDELVTQLQPRKPGDKVKLTVLDAKGLVRELEIPLGTRPGAGAQAAGLPRVALGADVEATEDDGLVLTEVLTKGSAEQAGLKVGDVLVMVDNLKIAANSSAALFKLLMDKNAGDKLKVRYRRGADTKETEVVLQARTTVTPERPYAGRLAGQAPNVQEQQGPDGVNTGGIYKSSDGGDTWSRINSLNERPFYFSVVRVDPTDEKIIYSLGINFWRSTDGGKTFDAKGINTGLHSDHHDLWINPKDGRHMIIGTDGGFYITYDRAAHWEHLNNFALGQFYHICVDNRRPYRVYGGLQDNGSWGGPSQTLRPSGPGNADYLYINGGDGFVCRVDPFDPDLVYAESQDGNLMRRHLTNGGSKLIRPKAQPGAGKYRFNWNTPFILSQHNPHLFYSAGNYVFRSVKQGDDLKIISPQITRTGRGSATALAESPKNPDVLWVGADDGAVWLTRDGGKTWTDLSDQFKAAGMPGPRWVATIEPSRAVAGRCYVAFDAHRSDDDEPYVFVTEDYGQTWKSLRGNLPSGSSRVLREDIVNPDLLYLGTEFAAWASINRGASWFKINGTTLPTVAVHEFAQPTTAPELVAGTHGRSIWVLDVTTLRQAKVDVVKDKAHLFAPGTVTRWRIDATREGMFRTGTRAFVGANPSRTAAIDFVLPKKVEKLSLKVVDLHGKTVRDLDVGKASEAGLQRIAWDLTGNPQKKAEGKQFKKGGGGPKGPPQGPSGAPVTSGSYRVVLIADGQELSQTLVIEPDPNQRSAQLVTDEAAEDLERRRLQKEEAPVLDP